MAAVPLLAFGTPFGTDDYNTFREKKNNKFSIDTYILKKKQGKRWKAHNIQKIEFDAEKTNRVYKLLNKVIPDKKKNVNKILSFKGTTKELETLIQQDPLSLAIAVETQKVLRGQEIYDKLRDPEVIRMGEMQRYSLLNTRLDLLKSKKFNKRQYLKENEFLWGQFGAPTKKPYSKYLEKKKNKLKITHYNLKTNNIYPIKVEIQKLEMKYNDMFKQLKDKKKMLELENKRNKKLKSVKKKIEEKIKFPPIKKSFLTDIRDEAERDYYIKTSHYITGNKEEKELTKRINFYNEENKKFYEMEIYLKKKLKYQKELNTICEKTLKKEKKENNVKKENSNPFLPYL